MAEIKRSILLKYGEMILKGANRSYFETTLLRQIRRRLSRIGEFSVTSSQSTITVDCDDDFLIEEALEECKKIFGIVTLTVAYRTEKKIEAILEGVKEFLVPTLRGKESFKADARRSDKRFPLSSPEICRLVGGAVLEEMGDKIKVDVKNPEIVLWVEIRDEWAYLHAGREKGAGGLPYGTGGKSLLLLSGGIDSPVAGWRMARRGAKVDCLHFESYPYTSERAKEKVISLARKLCHYTDSINLAILSLTEIQLEIKEKCREEYFTLLLRRFMVRLANRVARHQGCSALITGESLGQVASQTMASLAVTDAVSELVILRPLIGMDKEEIVTTSRKIDCFETSILPYEDCCTVFTPRHPKLNPTEEELQREEAKLDIAALEEKAMGEIAFMRVERD